MPKYSAARLWAALFAFALWLVAPVAMAATLATTPANIYAELGAAKPGDTLSLASGNYGKFVISGHTWATPIVITSADPAHPAVFTGLGVGSSSGVIFTHVDLAQAGCTDAYYCFRIASSQHLTFDHVRVYGDPAIASTAQLNAFLVQDTTAVAIANSSFYDLAAGVIANRNDQMTISGNEFSLMNKGAIELGALTNSTVSKNVGHDFYTTPGGHADFIQLYTAGQTIQSHDDTFDGNMFYRGFATSTVPQGILLQDDAGTYTSPLVNFRLTNNVITGAQFNSITIDHPGGTLLVSGNRAQSMPGLAMDNVTPNYGWAAWIFVRQRDATPATISMTNNAAQTFMGPAGVAETPPATNVLLPAAN